MSEPEPVLLVERRDATSLVTLHRPDARNALSIALQEALIAAFRDAARDDAVAAVVLTGAGKAFCAGFDLKELSSGRGGGDGAGRQNELAAAIAECPKPVIGAINGFAITGGFELALACDLLVASTEARFADTHTRVGMVPGWGLSQRLPRLVGIHRAKELSLTGNFLDAATAERWGLVNRVVAPEALIPTCLALAADMASCVAAANRETKRLIDEGFAMPFGDAMPFENRAATDWARRVSGEAIGARREGVLERGRRQGS
ncbi:MAG: enoyl-CoA hydratase [Myxococcota bacterium]|nr:enoyl-CoA hydratase [Myxococcales bacterium]